eukprot:jgi/Chlat1/3928/Chrsp26S04029
MPAAMASTALSGSVCLLQPGGSSAVLRLPSRRRIASSGAAALRCRSRPAVVRAAADGGDSSSGGDRGAASSLDVDFAVGKSEAVSREKARLDRRKEIEEKFQPLALTCTLVVVARARNETLATRESGKFACRSCGYEYDPTQGDSSYPISKGTQFKDLPGDWQCPTCGAEKQFFNSKEVVLAGFAENQKYGLGGNSLTSGQKNLLIWGSLVFFFFLFILGYGLN